MGESPAISIKGNAAGGFSWNVAIPLPAGGVAFREGVAKSPRRAKRDAQLIIAVVIDAEGAEQ